MAWIPDSHRALILIERVRSRRNLVPDAIELFEVFFTEASEETPSTEADVEQVVGSLRDLARKFCVPPEPDSDENPETLVAAVYIQATCLVRAVRLQGYGGDDVQEIFREVTSLQMRLVPTGADIDSFGNSNAEKEIGGATILEFIVGRVGIGVAVQKDDYQEAFRSLGGILDWSLSRSIFESRHEPFENLLSEVPDKATWSIQEILEKALGMEGWVAGLDRIKEIDWRAIQSVCDNIQFTPYAEHTDRANILMGWTLDQLTPDQLRNIYRRQEDDIAERRLQSYFFTDDLWQALSDRARQALISADRAFIDSTSGRRAVILDELRIATEETLHQYFWEPLIERTKDQRIIEEQRFPRLQVVRKRLTWNNHSPNLGDYAKVLKDVGAKDFLRDDLGLKDSDEQFITRRGVKHFWRLSRSRNVAEHEHERTPGRKEVDALYAETVGIGQRGVLPELVRLLSRRTP